MSYPSASVERRDGRGPTGHDVGMTADTRSLHPELSLAPGDVWVFDPAGAASAVPDVPRRARILWSAPGSLGLDRVERRWQVGGLSGLGEVTGPWGVVLWDPRTGEWVVAATPHHSSG